MNLNTFRTFVKKEIVFCAGTLAAIISCFFIPPSKEYLGYINYEVILILFSLMLLSKALQESGAFNIWGGKICRKAGNLRLLSLLLILLCFFSSMLITNDVALITFVPFGLILLSRDTQGKKIIPLVIILQTIAANLGSMLTPFGNPQNLYLFTKMNLTLPEFSKIILPFGCTSLLMLIGLSFLVKKTPLENSGNGTTEKGTGFSSNYKSITTVFVVVFIVAVCSVLGLIPAYIPAILSLLATLILCPKNITKIDFMLLLTFCSFFIFTGNISRIDFIRSFLEKMMEKQGFWTSVLTSQIISNVPAALLLEPFSRDKVQVLLGVNIGGLGTLVASLASLISYKIYKNYREENREISKDNYLLVFTVLNLVFLVPLILMYFIIY